jgi:hypothetical protein
MLERERLSVKRIRRSSLQRTPCHNTVNAWNQVFQAVDHLARLGKLVLRLARVEKK